MQIINEKDFDAANTACEFLRAGKIISFATDTVYGIASDASNSKAVEGLYKIKKRDEKKPVAIFLKDLASAKKIFHFDELAQEIAQKYLPGALTLVLPIKYEALPMLAPNLNINNDGFVGFRIVNCTFIKKLFEKFDGILAVTSANISGQKAAITDEDVAKNLPNIDLLICGQTPQGEASTVAKISDRKINILRQGALKII